MDQQRVSELLDKYTHGLATADEKQELLKWYRTGAYQDATFPDDEDSVRDRMLLRLSHDIAPQTPKHYMRWISAAAVLLLMATCAYYFLKPQYVTPPLTVAQVKPAVVQPGGNKAVLTLSGGRQIILSGAQNGQLATQGNSVITKTADGQIVYDQAGAQATDLIAYNTVSTPNGGQFQVTLPDGSRVWLNAASSITYPSAFTGTGRIVKLSGEGYFEVAKDRGIPFKVDVIGKQQIEVLGTHFDIEAYTDDSAIKTTLLEGAVKLHYKTNHVVLKPGQMAVNDMLNPLQIKTANTEEVMAWKNGLFTFNDENIKDAMRKIARWYDVDVEYNGNILKKRLGGTVSRYKSITDLLDNITKTGSIHYKIEGRRVILMN